MMRDASYAEQLARENLRKAAAFMQQAGRGSRFSPYLRGVMRCVQELAHEYSTGKRAAGDMPRGWQRWLADLYGDLPERLATPSAALSDDPHNHIRLGYAGLLLAMAAWANDRLTAQYLTLANRCGWTVVALGAGSFSPQDRARAHEAMARNDLMLAVLKAGVPDPPA